jgi:hypothetical protein
MSAVADKLREARKLIERGWCRNIQAMDKLGRDVDPHDPEAVCWCVYGALGAVDAINDDNVLRPLKRAVGSPQLANWNDASERTQAEVLAAFDKAIELAEAQS